MKRFLLLLLLISANDANARLEVCNQTDLVLMIAIGYDTAEDRIASEGWWRIYPGFCEVPIDVAMLKGGYYLHAESNPRSTMPIDSFTWGKKKPLCVQLADFRVPNADLCEDGNVFVKFNKVNKNWRNSNKVNIYHNKRIYKISQRAKIAGVQRMLSILGYDMGVIDGVLGKKTVDVLDEIGQLYRIFGFDFKRFFPLLEKLIAEKQNLDN